MKQASESPDRRDAARPGRIRTVVLVGGGHAHVQLLRRWAMDPPPDARLVVVLDRPVAVYSGMVPGCVAGDYRLPELEIDVVPLARRAGASVILSAAKDLDPVKRELALTGRPAIRFDVVSLDVGSTVRELGLPGVAEHALATRPIGHFVHEVDERVAALTRLGRAVRVLIVGGGAAGCEIAFGLEARLRGAGVGAHVTIATSEPELLAGSAPRVRRRIAREAGERGLTVHPGTRIERVERDAALTTRGERLAADLIVWATGAAPIGFPQADSPAPLARDREGFIAIRNTLQTVDFEHVFAVGDCARLVDHPWVPRAGVYAVRQGPILDFNLRALLSCEALRRYRPQRDFLSLLNLGDGRALGAKWGVAATGRGVFRLKDRIDRGFVARFQVLEADAAKGAEAARMSGAMAEAMPCGGCAAKLPAAVLEAALGRLAPAWPDDSVVIGVAERDDVAVTRTPEGRLALHNIDAIRAFCDDPWLVARVAACNATSDLFAKGGHPRHAQALIGLPEADAERSEEMLHQALCGLRETLDGLSVTLLGGHTMSSEALSIGLAVTGDGPEAGELLRQRGAKPGDELWLTRPLGTGVVLAADMRGLARGEWVEAAHAAMLRTHAAGSRLIREAGATSATDVTGFGLAGHLLNLLRPAGLTARLDRRAIPLLPGARELFLLGLRSTAHAPNRAAFLASVRGASEFDGAWLFDPQTSGGLLFSLPPAAGPRLAEAFARAGEPAVTRIGLIDAGDWTDLPLHDAAPPAAGALLLIEGVIEGETAAARPPRD